MTSRTDEQSGPGVGQTASQARRITLLCWLLVLTMAASAECAWVVWLHPQEMRLSAAPRWSGGHHPVGDSLEWVPKIPIPSGG
jgi:hypothetical protein